ncbi:MAG: T9SS type A sorting domain-containing protein [Winogradskyella sp.]|uniref:T9SS type A sorting domain-containing protein n=1 Tax=Winogradskyella sp. TaxID=1883156 RepID=UPI0025D1A631|nr:T9SS type A sorting domain-containing protein [Winogradskyella sp.]NRB59882.1 T9SS type A sorting domain-containing protein [Winogradskyella sp.]
MNKNILFAILVLNLTIGFSQTFSIPDPNFEQALIDLNLDNTSPSDEIDGVMSSSVAANVTNLNISGKNISDLSGIGNFINLERLFVENNNLTTANFSNNLALERLTIYNNNLTTLDLSNHSSLERLYCQSNQITSLVLPTNSSLQRLECQFNNLSTIDLSSSVLLDDIKMQHNNFTVIDFSSNTLIEKIDAFNNQLTSVNLDNCDIIEDINFRNNQLTSLVLEDRPELLKINLEFNDLSSLTVKNVKSSAWNFYITLLNNPNLTCVAVSDPTDSENDWVNVDSQVFFSLDCNASTVAILDPNFEQALIDLGIDSDGTINGELLATDALGVTDLDVNSYNISDLTGIEFFTDLEVLTAFNNNLSSVDLSQNTGLTTILLALNNLTEIDLSSHPNLISLSLNDNSISTIDFSNNLQLQQVFLNNNLLSEIDVDMLSNLANLGVSGNTIVELDLSNNTSLQTLFCQDNNLVNLNVQNGNNTNVTNFEAENNSNLTCIQVDDISYSTVNWTLIDSQSFFGLDCAPSNDGCNEATPLDLGIVVTGTTQSATSSGLSPSCQQNGIILIDVWYEFEAPSSGSITVVANSVLSSIKVAIYDDCANGTPIACDSAGIVVNNLNPGQTYYAQVWVEASVGGRSQDTLVGDFDIQVADSSTLSVEENLVQEVQLFPNPASSQVTIKTHSGIDTISIFDVAGKEVLQVSAINQNDYVLNVQSLSKGIYLLQIHGQNVVMNKRLLIK